MVSDLVEYPDPTLGRLVVGRVERREQRPDGEWCLCVPGYRGSGIGVPEMVWVPASEVHPYVERPVSKRRGRRR